MGATVVSQGAGEIASELGLAISKKMKRLGSGFGDFGVWAGRKMVENFTKKHMVVLMGFLQGDLVWELIKVDMRLGLLLLLLFNHLPFLFFTFCYET